MTPPMVQAPPTSYARSGDARIAYQVVGEGPVDLVLVGGPASHLDIQWEQRETERSFARLASFARVVMFDRRGTGLSDPAHSPPTLDQQMDDLRAVMEAAGLERTALFGSLDAGLCAMYAATHPDEVTSLVLSSTSPAGAEVFGGDRLEQMLDVIENHWGEGRLLPLFAPSRVGDPAFEEWWSRYERTAASPAMARWIIEMFLQTDLRGVLPAIRVPTLVIHTRDNALVPVELGRETASLIPDARFVEVPGTDTYGWLREQGEEMDAIEEFLTGELRPREAERVLATVMFTDIVGSTDRASQLGDREWRGLLERHDALVRAELDRFRGREVKTMGDGFIATFDGPGRAVECARAVIDAVRRLGLEVRAGLHTGECEMLDSDVRGIAVHIGARVSELARAGEVLVSSTVRDLVVGSGLDFADRGPHALRGVPGEWRLYAVEASRSP